MNSHKSIPSVGAAQLDASSPVQGNSTQRQRQLRVPVAGVVFFNERGEVVRVTPIDNDLLSLRAAV